MTRLAAVCSLIPRSPVVADIGCDHGKVSEYIIKNALFERELIVNDISAASLKKAHDYLGKLGVSTRSHAIVFDCCDGADLPKGIDCAIIAGLGGREILRILQHVAPKCAVLSPQNFAHGLRQGFRGPGHRSGYAVDADTTVEDNGKFYDVIRVFYRTAERDAMPEPIDECALAYGFFYKQKNPALLARILRDRQKFESYPKTPENQKKLQIIEEALAWQQ